MLTLLGHTATIEGVAISADGQWVVSASGDRVLKVWDLHRDATTCSLKQQDLYQAVAIAVDSNYLVAAIHDGDLLVRDLSSSNALKALLGHAGTVLAIALASEQHLIVSGGSDHQVRLWHQTTGAELLTCNGHSYPVLLYPGSRAGQGPPLTGGQPLRTRNCATTLVGGFEFGIT
jgi:WD40 repeat protein